MDARFLQVSAHGVHDLGGDEGVDYVADAVGMGDVRVFLDR